MALRGALVVFSDSFPLPLPNVIIFQYNPETLTHAWTPAAQGGHATTDDAPSNPLSVRGTPGETFSFKLAIDANDMITDGNAVEQSLAKVSGVYVRLAALEMLLFPAAPPILPLVGTVSASLSINSSGISISASVGTAPRTIPAGQLPLVLFVWGPGRIVPVRVASLSTTETLYDPVLLNPTHIEANITLRVLTPEEIALITGTLGTIASTAYNYTQTLRQGLALANLGEAIDSIIGLLPI